jgi:hypothetical protein
MTCDAREAAVVARQEGEPEHIQYIPYGRAFGRIVIGDRDFKLLLHPDGERDEVKRICAKVPELGLIHYERLGNSKMIGDHPSCYAIGHRSPRRSAQFL